MRKKERQLSEQEAWSILKAGQYGILSTVSASGQPYGVPVSFAAEGSRIYFHGTAEGGLKTENLRFQPKACFTVVGSTQVLPAKFSTKYESAIAFGTVALAEDPEHGLMTLIEKYSPEYAEIGRKYVEGSLDRTNVYEMTVTEISGKARRND
jgi:nitroimidazol reductase NimA-like FMN-containing flavoprotein (pyridoxamine 5'-phosphate oxidase superfamily)